jgi:Cu(I)/Ag(I) efflux system membrane protein CusA/SilA
MIERLADWSGRNPLLVSLLALLAAAWGVRELVRTPLDALPDLSDVQVLVEADWEGRSPSLVEDQITYPISSRFVSAPKVKRVRGESMFGKSLVSVVFEDGTDPYWARSRVLEALEAVRGSLPEGVAPALGPDATGVGWVYEYALTDDSGKLGPEGLRSLQDWTLRYALGAVPGVAEVASVGGFVKEYQVQLDPGKLVAYGVGVSEVADAVRKGNRDAGGRTLEVSGAQYYVRGRGYLRSVDDLAKIAVRTDARGVPVLVGDLGTVALGPAARNGAADLDGLGEAVGGIVVMRQGENALRVIDGVKAKLREIAPALPPGVKVVPVYDRSKLILRSVATLRGKLVEECLVVAAVCLLFLWHGRSALVAIVMLPLAIVLAFIPFHALGLTANVMSLGGIAVAVGAMVDAAIVMVESAHRTLADARERAGGAEPSSEARREAVLAAVRRVGRPLFFSLLVVTVSFLPVFALGGESGRLFHPLAYTKTFSMFFAALLSVTLVPVLMVWLVRGRIAPEEKNPVNRLLVRLYRPAVEAALRHRRLALGLACAALALTAIPVLRLGSEFMPPLDEGDLLYMPTAIPGISVDAAARTLQRQDRIIRGFPEVESVFGKAGQADTATDPAPLSMFETTVQLKPREQWRPGMTWEKLTAEIGAAAATPGMANVFWMPIQTRTQMLATGFRSNLGVKVFGRDLGEIDRLAAEVASALGGLPGTRSAFAERTLGGRYLDVVPDRDAIARYGLSVEDVNAVVEAAIGGATVTRTVEGRERYPVTVRLARDFREDIGALGRIPVKTSSGAQIPLGQVARIGFAAGPPSVRSEGGRLVGYVFVDAAAPDVSRYVAAAEARIAGKVPFPPGYYREWAGTYQSLREARATLAWIVPVTLLVIFILLYLNTRSAARTGIVLLAVPFSLIGAFWLVWLLGYQLSVAVWIGLIALAGIDAETGVVMLLYLDEAYRERAERGQLRNRADLLAAIREGAVRRLRPKAMTLCAILFGLLPILWSGGTGADTMKRIAAPMVGGIVTSALLELLLYPVIYALWRERELPE